MAENGDIKKRAERTSTVLKKKLFLEALGKSLGVISPAMKAAGIESGQTVRNWRDGDEKFAAAMKECEAKCGDFVESALLKKIQGGNTAAIIFYCKTKLKDRGYSERNELTGKDGKDLVPRKEYDLSKLSDEQMEILLEIGSDILNGSE